MGELAAELGTGWTRESYPPPGVAFEALRQSAPRQKSVEDGERQQGPCPVASQRGSQQRPAWKRQINGFFLVAGKLPLFSCAVEILLWDSFFETSSPACERLQRQTVSPRHATYVVAGALAPSQLQAETIHDLRRPNRRRYPAKSSKVPTGSLTHEMASVSCGNCSN